MRRPTPSDALLAVAVIAFVTFWYLALAGILPSFALAIQTSACKTAEECEKNGPLSHLWDWLFHDATSFFTFVLSLFTGALVWVALKADSTARMVARNGTRQTVIARRQMLIYKQQTDILEKQRLMQRQEFLITHRPKIRIRSVAGPLKLYGETAEFIITYSNIGNTDAKVLSKKLEVVHRTPDGTLNVIIEGVYVDEVEILGPGVSGNITRPLPEKALSLFDGGVVPLIVSGAILYEDGNMQVRATSVARVNVPPSIRLIGMDGVEDMNYED